VTPFMLRVAELLGVAPAPEPPVYRTRHAAAVRSGVGAQRHVATRALAEQLVCEANAVLAHAGAATLTLRDEVAPDELVFVVSLPAVGRAVRFATRFADGTARARMQGEGVPAGDDVELADAEAVADVLIRLLLTAPPAGR
jgi:hypothetical protein